MRICIDSNIVVWGIKKQATVGQEQMIEKTNHLLKWVDENKHQIIIPTIVIAEVLAVEPVEAHASYIDVISKNFIVADFDLRAATRYAQILNGRFPDLKEYAKDNGIRREKMKIDHLIIACGLVHGATRIYTTDNNLIKFCGDLLEAKSLPELPAKQETLF